MTRFATGLCLLCLLTLTASAQSSPGSGLPAITPGRAGCPEGLLRACTAAADELAAARKLIDAQGRELDAARTALDAQKERTRLLAEQNGALVAQVDALKTALDAQRQATAKLDELVGKFQLRVADLEKDLAKAKRRTKQAALAGFLGGAVAVGVAVGR